MESIAMPKVLITGAGGQVGYKLTALAGKSGFSVFAAGHADLDITDRSQVNSAVARELPDVIINAAAYTAVDRAESDREAAYELNCRGAGFLAEAAHKARIPLLHISTDYVYPGKGTEPEKEDDPTAPSNVYGQTKLDGEKAALDACERTIVMRTAWVFCEHGNNFIKTMLRLGKTHPELSVVDDQIGGPTYAGDIAESLLRMASSVLGCSDFTEYGIYNYCGSPFVSWREFAEAIFSGAAEQGILKEKVRVTPIPSSAYPTPAVRPLNSRLSMEKIGRVFGISPSDWKAALRDLSGYAPS